MKVLIRYTGLLGEMVGMYSEEVNVPENIRVRDLVLTLASRHGRLGEWLEKLPLLVVRVNGVEVTGDPDYKLEENDVVEFSTPLFEGG